jgi:streptogramin lyase
VFLRTLACLPALAYETATRAIVRRRRHSQKSTVDHCATSSNGAQSAAPSVVGSSEPLHVLPSFDDEGSLFFTQRNLGYIGRLDTRNQITEWSLGPTSLPHDMAFVGETIILTEEGTNQIGQFNSEKNSIKAWPVPTAGSFPWHLARVNAYIYFSEAVGNKIGRLNLVTNQVSEWNTPGLAPEGLDAAGTKVWCVEEA